MTNRPFAPLPALAAEVRRPVIPAQAHSGLFLGWGPKVS